MHLIFLLTICFISIIVNMQSIDADKKRRYEVIFIGFVLFLFAALRHPSVGTDLQRYCDSYVRMSTMSFSEILAAREQLRDPVFHCFIHALSFISEDPQFMMVVIGAWVAFSFSYFAYHSRGNVLMTYLLFICLRIYSFTLTGLRQAIALGFIWLAFVFLQKNKKFRFVLFVIFAAMFHASAIVFLVALPLKFIKNEKFVLTTVLAVVAVNFLSGDQIVYNLSRFVFADRFESYISTAIYSRVSLSTTFILYVLIFVFITVLFSKIKRNDSTAVGRFNIVCVGMMFSFIGQGFPNMFRIAYYFICNLFPLFTDAIKVFTSQHERVLINLFMPILLIAQYVILGTSGGTENYLFFWQELVY